MIQGIRQYEGTNSELIKGLERELFDSIRIAVRNKNQEITRTLLNFIFKQISSSVEHNNLQIFNQYIFLPYYTYSDFSGYGELSQLLLNEYSSKFSSLIDFNLKFRHNKATDADKQKINEFYYAGYFGYVSFLHILIERADDKAIENVFHSYNEINSTYNSLYYRRRYDLLQLLIKGEFTKYESEIKDIKIKDYPIAIHRRCSLALKSWLFYLYHLNKIDKEVLLNKEKHIHISYNFFELLLSDISDLTGIHSKLGLGEWDFMERKSGVYSPPSPYYWIILGATVLLLRSTLPDFNIQLIEEKDEYAYLYDSFKEKLELIKSNFQKWQDILKLTEENFEKKSENILLKLGELKRRHYTQIAKEINEQELEGELVEDFKNELAESWKSNSILLNVFERFDAKKVLSFPVPDDKARLIEYSWSLEEFKQMLVKDHHDTIYGVNEFGAEFARMMEGKLISEIVNKKNDRTKSSSYSYLIDEGIAKIEGKGYRASLIIAPPEIHLDDEFNKNDSNFMPRWRFDKPDEPIEYIGKYKDIPIVSIYSRYHNNNVIVTDFKEAFSLEVIENESWFHKMLEISVRLLSPDEIAKEFLQNSSKWLTDKNGFSITEEEAKIRIAATILLSFTAYAKIKVVNPDAFDAGIIIDKNT